MGEGFEWLFDSLALESAHFEKFKSHLLSKSGAVSCGHLRPGIQINFIGDDDSCQLFAAILALDSIVPLPEEMECIWVGNVIDQHNQISFAKELKSNFLKDVLASDVYQVEFNLVVGVFFIQSYILHMVLAALGHHVLMVELLLHGLVHQTSLSHGRLSGHNDSSSKN